MWHILENPTLLKFNILLWPQDSSRHDITPVGSLSASVGLQSNNLWTPSFVRVSSSLPLVAPNSDFSSSFVTCYSIPFREIVLIRRALLICQYPWRLHVSYVFSIPIGEKKNKKKKPPPRALSSSSTSSRLLVSSVSLKTLRLSPVLLMFFPHVFTLYLFFEIIETG